jgi:DNA-3-methyladenine glycosylase II
MIQRFTEATLPGLYTTIIQKDDHLHMIVKEYGHPPLWIRPNNFETLVLTILEQQVSLASAYAAYKKLKERISTITPHALLQLTDVELRGCYLSRQKIVYTRELARALTEESINLRKLQHQPDEVVRHELKKMKGIGDWTVDIYLLHALRRTDIFPVGDLALLNAIKMVKGMDKLSKEQALEMAEEWKPYRSIATMLFWHYYIKKKNIRILH